MNARELRLGRTTHIAPLMVAVLRRYGIDVTEEELRERPTAAAVQRPLLFDQPTPPNSATAESP
jgi:hypothetical protein